MNVLLRSFSFVVLGVLAALGFKFVIMLTVTRAVINHQPGPCRTVEGIEFGAEDIELIPRLNAAFVTSGLFYMSKRAPQVKGKMFLYNFSQPQGQHMANELKIKGKLDLANFHPHGMSSLVDSGQILLYVINHDNAFKHSVEVFRYDEHRRYLIHLKTIRDPLFVRPNNLVVVGKDQFILTNDGHAQNAYYNTIETLFALRAGSVIFFDGKKSHMLIDDAVSPNGIAMDQLKRHIFVASPIERSITVCSIAKDFKSVELVSVVDLDTMPDNVIMDSAGNLWTGTHPKVRDILAHGWDPDNMKITSPSQVLRIAFSTGYEKWKITEPYANDGSQLTASTVAVPYYGQLLMGSIYRTLVHCDIAHASVV